MEVNFYRNFDRHWLPVFLSRLKFPRLNRLNGSGIHHYAPRHSLPDNDHSESTSFEESYINSCISPTNVLASA